jgi:phage terminase small subunit
VLNPKQQDFCREYLIDLNGKQAAIRAGYSQKTAEVQASRLLSLAKVQAYLKTVMDERSKRTEITQDYVLNTIVSTVERCQQAEPVMERNQDGDMQPTGEYKFDATNVLKGSELLGRHLGMWNDKLKIAHSFEQMSDEELEAEIASLKSSI